MVTQNSAVSWIERGPWFKSQSGHDYVFHCDIWWLNVGSRLGPQALKSACLADTSVVPSRFGDKSN